MAPSIPITEPESLMAGATATWQRTFADYTPADGYTLKYYFAGPDAFNVAADGASGVFLVTVQTTDTEAKPAGIYGWRAFVERTVNGVLERWQVATGALSLEPDITQASGNSQQLFAEQMVAALEAAIAGRTGADLEAFGQAGKQVTKIPFKELNYRLGIWNGKLWRARNPRRTSPEHQTRFTKSPAVVGGFLSGTDGGPL